jgi:phage gp36-like protein
MTAYITQDDLVARFGAAEIQQLSDREMAGQINTARVAQAIADTCARIDGYLAAQYDLPLPSVPAALPTLACDICRYLLAELPTGEMRDRHNDALSWLRDVASGKFGLGLTPAGTELAPAPAGVPQFRARSDGRRQRDIRGFLREREWE